ncbi:carbon-nitrogen hydrolase family protein [Phosphitispora sp. TUW77]|uniref:carbon-nitrogen hydrolase family protein n=1 Tax=Phosphitispora sp. TUW77 TaxID=3152361 RepID=UPI003AB27191
MQDKWILGIIQNRVTEEKARNINKARDMISEAAARGARAVALPEMFNCPYDNKAFPLFAESYPGGETIRMLSEAAAANKIYVFGGSIPEEEGDRIYNTCFVFGPDGTFLARHRKMHLFDVDIKGKLKFKESDALGAGNEITVVNTSLGKIGVGICYDIRFPELARLMSLQGAVLMILPAAFNMVSGPAHWELSVRMRAVDNQFYVAGIAPARDETASYVAYGHSVAADPWGQVIGALDEKEGLLMVEIDPKRIEQVRNEFPLLKHRRQDIYEVKGKY